MPPLTQPTSPHKHISLPFTDGKHSSNLNTKHPHVYEWYTKHTHTHKHLSVNSWSVCVRVSACVQRRIWLGCVFNSQCWRKRQKINTRLMGSIVIPTSCHSQRLFTAQQWARHSLSTHTGSLVYLIFSVDICACAQRDIEMDRWALARHVKCLV